MATTYSYSGATYNLGRLSEELVAGGVTLYTVRGDTAAIDVVCADGTAQATVDAIVTAHVGTATPPYDYPPLTGGTTTFVRADGTLSVVTTGLQLTSEKNAANGYAGLNANSRITKGVICADDVIIGDDTKGVVLKSPNLHYWRGTIDNAGAVTWTDLGTSPP